MLASSKFIHKVHSHYAVCDQIGNEIVRIVVSSIEFRKHCYSKFERSFIRYFAAGNITTHLVKRDCLHGAISFILRTLYLILRNFENAIDRVLKSNFLMSVRGALYNRKNLMMRKVGFV